MIKRYSTKEFPPYQFIPGKHPHPEKEGGYHFGKTIEVKPLDPDNPQDNEAYLYAIDLYNHKYYWEAHVWWEALWHKAGRVGELADFLKALIKLAAAGVKDEMGMDKAAQGHRERAEELLESLQNFHGLDKDCLNSKILKFKD